MLKYQIVVNGEPAEVWLDTTDPNLSVDLEYSRDVPAFREWLELQHGAFGHFIDEATSPIDLHHVLSGDKAQQFFPELIEGEEIVQSYDPDIPGDAVT